MSLLIKYLNDNYAKGPDDTIAVHFMEKFGVNVKTEDDLFLFKYNQLSVKWTEKITHECRGCILSFREGAWKFISRPFDKFFNVGEFYCSFNIDDFKDKKDQYSLVEKADGTCIQLYYDGKFWRASTLGSITPTEINDTGKAFDVLFWEMFGDNVSDADIGFTFVFELCSWHNRIVSKYPTPRLYFLGARDNSNGLSSLQCQ
jgi:hypothetical protein